MHAVSTKQRMIVLAVLLATVFVSVLWVVFSRSEEKATGSVTVTKGVEYGRGEVQNGNNALLMDIYERAQSCSAPRPLVLVIHGGGFESGSRSSAVLQRVGRYLAERGYVAASIDYRMIGDDPVSKEAYVEAFRIAEDNERVDAAASALEDTVTAVQFLRTNAHEYCIDPERVALWGDSAGAALALTTAYSLNNIGLPDLGIGAVIDNWGVMPSVEHIEQDEAAVIITHGTADQTAPYTEALKIKTRAENVGIPVQLLSIEGSKHGHGAINLFTTKVGGMTLIDRVVSFLEVHL